MKTQNISKAAVGTASKTADENGLSKNKTRDFPIVGIASAGGLEEWNF
jgi:hypothetical protein